MDRLVEKKRPHKNSYGAVPPDVHRLSEVSQDGTPILEKEADDLGVRTYDSTTGLAIMLNYIIGTGCFGLPMAFYQGGLVFGTLLLIFGCVVMFVSANYVLEAMARARGVHDAREGYVPHNFIGYVKFGYTDMLQTFAGDWGRIAVMVCISFYSFGTLAAYASMFASSTASLLGASITHAPCDVYAASPAPGCISLYYVMMAIFAAVVISMALRNMGDQAAVQRLLTGYRIVAFAIMLVTLAVKLAADRDVLAERALRIGSFNPAHFADGFGPVFLALCMHYNMPDAIQPMRNKLAAGTVTYIALALSSMVYLMLGIGGALAFETPNAVATLNWSDYTSCGDGWTPCDSAWRSAIGYIIRLTIILFPVVTVTSAYPLVCVTVGDNLMSSVPANWVSSLGARGVQKLVRLVAAIPPLVFATAFRGITFLFAITGLFGFVIGLLVPVGLQLVSRRYFQKRWPTFSDAADTPYTTILSGAATSVPLLIIAVIATLYGFATVKLH